MVTLCGGFHYAKFEIICGAEVEILTKKLQILFFWGEKKNKKLNPGAFHRATGIEVV